MNKQSSPKELTPEERKNLHLIAAMWQVEYEDTGSELARRERLRALALLGFKLVKEKK